MKLFNFLFSLKKKQIEPKLFVFVLNWRNFNHLALQSEYEFESTLVNARKEFAEYLKKKGTTEEIDPQEIMFSMYASATMMDIFGEFVDSDVGEITKKEQDKNEIMAEILQKKDETLIGKYADKLSDNDKKYLLEQLRK